jgi:arylsulfatase A-like enzyme
MPEDVAIPWIVWGDGVPQDLRLPAVSTLDTAPTILRLLGRTLPPAWQGRPVSGIAEGRQPP